MRTISPCGENSLVAVGLFEAHSHIIERSGQRGEFHAGLTFPFRGRGGRDPLQKDTCPGRQAFCVHNHSNCSRYPVITKFSRGSGGLRTTARVAGVGAAGYVTYAAVTWLRYGHLTAGIAGRSADPLLDTFMPAYEIAERH